jgi:hypothetical protein
MYAQSINVCSDLSERSAICTHTAHLFQRGLPSGIGDKAISVAAIAERRPSAIHLTMAARVAKYVANALSD